jgi:hypothetical protein
MQKAYIEIDVINATETKYVAAKFYNVPSSEHD